MSLMTDAEIQADALRYLSQCSMVAAEMYRRHGNVPMARQFLSLHIQRREQARALAKQGKMP